MDWLDEPRRRLKDEVVAADRGPFAGWWEALLRHAPDTLQHVHDFLSAAESSGAISDKLKHLIWTATDSVVTHIYPRGIGVHAKIALEHGASPEEVAGALEVASVVCLNSYFHSSRALALVTGEDADAAAREAEFAARIRAIGDGPGNGRGLDPISRELIFLAAYGCPAVSDADGVVRHAQQALVAGASPEQLRQALKLGACIGVHPISSGIVEIASHFEAVDAAVAASA